MPVHESMSVLLCKEVPIHKLPLIELLKFFEGLPIFHMRADQQCSCRFSFCKIFPRGDASPNAVAAYGPTLSPVDVSTLPLKPAKFQRASGQTLCFSA